MAWRLSLLVLALGLCGPARAVIFTYTQATGGGTNIPLGYPVPLPVDSLTPVDGFRSYASLHARHQALDSASERVTGIRIGTTLAGREIWAYVLSDGDDLTDDGGPEGAVLIDAGIHAREWSTPEAATGLIERIAGNEDDQGFYRYLLDNERMIIIPVLNVDGFLQTQRFPTQVTDSRDTPRDGRMRRKNMRGVDEDIATLGDNLFGIDLNRNNAPYFGSNNQSSGDPTSLIYHGPAPASEPEVLALQAAGNLAGNRLRFYVDTHSFSQVYIAPMTGNGRRNALTGQLAARMRAVTGNSYAYDPGSPGFGIGSTDEYFAENYQVPSYTLETEPGPNGAVQYGGLGVSHDGFILPENQVARLRRELADAMSLAFYRQAGPPSLHAASITRADTGEAVYAATWTRSGAARSLDVATHLSLSPGVSYRLNLVFDKPMRWRNGSGNVVDFAGQGVSLAPTLSLEGKRPDGTSFTQSLGGDANGWLNTAGAFFRYRDDSFQTEFTLAADSPVLTASLLQLAVTAADLSGQALDSNPATPVDWSGGAWTGYENSTGQAGDTGGTDRNFRLKDDGSGPFVPVPPTPTPPAPQPPDTGGGGGGGGGSLAWMQLVTFACLIVVRQRRIIRQLRWSTHPNQGTG